jgi:hypothetical protein
MPECINGNVCSVGAVETVVHGSCPFYKPPKQVEVAPSASANTTSDAIILCRTCAQPGSTEVGCHCNECVRWSHWRAQ